MADKSDGGCGSLIAIGLFGIAIYSCSHKSPEERSTAEQAAISGETPAPSGISGAVSAANPLRGDFNEDRATDAANGSLSGETYEGVVGSSDCTDDCSGHEAGWRWAAEGNDCGGGGSESFDDGCRAFQTAVEDRVEEARSRYASGEDTFAGEE